MPVRNRCYCVPKRTLMRHRSSLSSRRPGEAHTGNYTQWCKVLNTVRSLRNSRATWPRGGHGELSAKASSHQNPCPAPGTAQTLQGHPYLNLTATPGSGCYYSQLTREKTAAGTPYPRLCICQVTASDVKPQVWLPSLPPLHHRSR